MGGGDIPENYAFVELDYRKNFVTKYVYKLDMHVSSEVLLKFYNLIRAEKTDSHNVKTSGTLTRSNARKLGKYKTKQVFFFFC